MALPTVHFFDAAAGTDSALISVWMPKLQELLFAAGWTIEYADSDAIGTGSSSVPAWDKTPANNTDAGIAVYRMPLNDHTTRWYVRMRPGWGSATTVPFVRGMQLGLTHEAGAVSGAGTEMAPTQPTTVKDTACAVSVSEDGFLFVNGHSTNTPVTMVERTRTLDGTVQDDVLAWNKGTNSAAAFPTRHVSAAIGVVSTLLPVALQSYFIGGTAIMESLEVQDASEIVIIGPYYPGGLPLFAPPRLGVLASPADVAGGMSRVLTIDGGGKLYKAMPGSVSTTLGIYLVATE
jgi:hypothetical protein